MHCPQASDHKESCPFSPKRTKKPGILSGILDSMNVFAGSEDSHEEEDGEEKQDAMDVLVSFSEKVATKPVVSQIIIPSISVPSSTSVTGPSVSRSILKVAGAKEKAAKKVRFSDSVTMRTYRKNDRNLKENREYVQEILSRNREELQLLMAKRRKAAQNARRGEGMEKESEIPSD